MCSIKHQANLSFSLKGDVGISKKYTKYFWYIFL
jgi:hypothetical protein